MRSLGRNAATLCFFTLVAVGFTWPLAQAPLAIELSRHFDYFTLLWVIDQGADLPLDGHTLLASWPLGQDLRRADSFLLLAAGALAGGGVGSRVVAAAFSFFGPVLSAWAAERMAARALGATYPWSLLAGLAYGFSGITATALLEGHVYAVADPWLPLLAWNTLLVLDGRGTARHGLLAGLCWALALLTTAYSGINATLLLVLLVAWGLGRERRTPAWGPLGILGAVVLAVGLAYVGMFASGSLARLEAHTAQASVQVILESGSAQPATLLAWAPVLDQEAHSISPVLGLTMLALSAFAPRVLRRGEARGLLVAGLVATALSLGPSLQLGPAGVSVPWLLRPLCELDGPGQFFLFPVRLVRVSTLAFGGVAALVATRLAARRFLPAVPLLACATLDALVGTGVAFRSSGRPLVTPSALHAITAEGAVLELFPEFLGSSRSLAVYYQNLACSQQVAHGRPLVNPCLGTTVATGPDAEVTAWLHARLLAGDAVAGDAVADRLGALGIGTVVVRPLLYPANTRQAVLDGLGRWLGPPVAESRDGGEWIVVHEVPSSVAADPGEARAAYSLLVNGGGS